MKLTRGSDSKESKPKKKSKEVKVDPKSLTTVQGSFDLSNNAFGKAERVRRLLTGFTLATAAGLTAMALVTIALNNDTADKEAATQDVTVQGQDYLLTLADLDSAGGYSATNLRAHILPRQQKYVSVVTGEVDYVKVYEQSVAAVTNSGLTLQSIGFSIGAPSTPAPTDGEDAAAAPAGSANLVQVSISASGPTSAGSTFINQLSSVPGFSVVEESFSGAGDETVFSVVVNINPDTGAAFYTKRAQDLSLMDEYGLIKQGAVNTAPADPAPTTPAPTDPNGVPVDPNAPAPTDPNGVPVDPNAPATEPFQVDPNEIEVDPTTVDPSLLPTGPDGEPLDPAGAP